MNKKVMNNQMLVVEARHIVSSRVKGDAVTLKELEYVDKSMYDDIIEEIRSIISKNPEEIIKKTFGFDDSGNYIRKFVMLIKRYD